MMGHSSAPLWVVKAGGSLLAGEYRSTVATSIRQLVMSGKQVLVVHGGGRALSATMERLGQEPVFVDGLRVTPPEVLDTALMVLAGLANKQLVSSLLKAGVRACGLTAMDDAVVTAAAGAALGRVAVQPKSQDVRPQLLRLLLGEGLVPVVASLCWGEDLQPLNVNADTLASTLAIALKAESLVLLTDVPGLLDSDQRPLNQVTSAGLAQMKQEGTIHSGMLPKVEACLEALQGGVNKAHIIDGRDSTNLMQLMRGLPQGTAFALGG